MKAEYKIKVRPIDETGKLCEWDELNIRLNARVTLEYDDGTIRSFQGIMTEE